MSIHGLRPLVLNRVTEEVYWDIYNSLYITNDNESLSQKVYKVVATGHPRCDSPSPCFIPSFDFYNAIGNSDLNILGGEDGAASVAAGEGKLYNMINIFYAAVRLDLGHWTPENVSPS